MIPLCTLLSLLLLGLFGGIESIKALRVKSQHPRSATRERTSTLLIVLAGSIWLLSFLDAVWLALPPKPLLPGLQWVGLLLFALGILVRLLAHRDLGRFYNYMITIEPDHQLVTTGIYGWIRHPLYLGTFLVFLGFPLANQSLVGLALFLIQGIPTLLFRISREERLLQKAFPEAYRAYKKRTGALLPFC